MSGQAQQTVKMTTDALEAASRTVEELTKALLEILQNFKNNRMVKKLLDFQKAGGELDFYNDSVLSSKVITDCFEENKIPFAKCMSSKDHRTYFITRSCDRELIKNKLHIACINQSKVALFEEEEFYKKYEGKKVVKYENIKPYELMELWKKAKEKDVEFYPVQHEQDENFDFVISKDDKIKMDTMLLDCSVKFSGESGKMEINSYNIQMSAINKASEKLHNSKDEFYIVNSEFPEHYIKVGASSIEEIKSATTVNLVSNISRDSSKFDEVLVSLTNNMESPVVLSEKKFSKNKDVLKVSLINELDKTCKDVKDKYVEPELKFKKLLTAKILNGIDDNELKKLNISNIDINFENFFKEEIDQETLDAEQYASIVDEFNNLPQDQKQNLVKCANEVLEKEKDHIRFATMEVTKEMVDDINIENRINRHSGINYNDNTKDKELTVEEGDHN